MNTIITIIVRILNTISKGIWKLKLFFLSLIPPDEINAAQDKPLDVRYRQFKVDDDPFYGPAPFKEVSDKLDYQKIIKENNIKPIKRRKPCNIDPKAFCPNCRAPHDFLYENSKGTQLQCKVCQFLFWPSAYSEKQDVSLRCPHCKYQLAIYHKRKDFNVFRCINMDCSFYLNNINSMNREDKRRFKKNPSLFKVHYIYRAFNIKPPDITDDFREFVKSPIDLNKAYNSWHVIGLILTYRVNYGMSYRQTSAIMADIHNVYLTHQTVFNYCKSVSTIVHPVLEYYPYELSSELAGDETYLKIMGKQHYTFFIFDTIKKIITSYRCFKNRDSLSAIKAVYQSLAKYDEIPEDLKMYTDGNPIYPLAQQYWAEHGYLFDLIQIIGLKNLDPVSKQYRSYKQIIERLNRTLKYYYRPTNGLGSIENANSYMILFSVCFNFLRPHQALNYKVPQYDESIQSMPNMPAKWLALIELGYKYTSLYH